MNIPFTHVGSIELDWKQRGIANEINYVMLPVGEYVISIQHSNKHYCDAHTVEIAIFRGKDRIKDFAQEMPHSPLFDGMFAYDSVAGWIDADTLLQVVNELERLSK